MRKNIIYKEIIFISDNISVLKIDNQMNIIGVYLNCNQNNTESFNNHLHDVEQLAGILKTISNENVLIIGDFNSDFKRKSKFDKILQQFVKKNNLVIKT
jgi:exonuclease III